MLSIDHNSSPLAYNSKIQEASKDEMRQVQKVLKGLDLPKSVFIYTTGNAGKLERNGRENSPMSLVLLCDPSLKEQTLDKVRLLGSDCFPKEIEWKESLSNLQNPNIFFPSHFIHQIFLIGDPNKLDPLFYQFVEEVQAVPSAKRQKFRRQFVVNHLNQLKHVIEGTDVTSVDLKNGVICYDGLKQQATKHSLLLPIQFVLDLRIIDAIRVLGHWPRDYVSFLKFMPKAIPDLIEYMAQERLLLELDCQDIEDLKDAYRLGLMYFQMGQNLKKFSVADKGKLQEAYANTHRILGKINSGQFCEQRKALT